MNSFLSLSLLSLINSSPSHAITTFSTSSVKLKRTSTVLSLFAFEGAMTGFTTAGGVTSYSIVSGLPPVFLSCTVELLPDISVI